VRMHRLLAGALLTTEIVQDYAAFTAFNGDVRPWQKMPAGPVGPGQLARTMHAEIRGHMGPLASDWTRQRRRGSVR
jgi:hypothetical protein